jgi:hypothetical protein
VSFKTGSIATNCTHVRIDQVNKISLTLFSLEDALGIERIGGFSVAERALFTMHSLGWSRNRESMLDHAEKLTPSPPIFELKWKLAMWLKRADLSSGSKPSSVFPFL